MLITVDDESLSRSGSKLSAVRAELDAFDSDGKFYISFYHILHGLCAGQVIFRLPSVFF